MRVISSGGPGGSGPRCLKRFANEGMEPCGSIASFGGGDVGEQWLAIGGHSGVVNVYAREELLKNAVSNPKPLRSMRQLRTCVDHLAFHPNGEILCFSSAKTRDALKLAHMPTCEVFANWPTRTTPLEGCNHGSHERCASAAGRVRATVRRLFWPSSLTC